MRVKDIRYVIRTLDLVTRLNLRIFHYQKTTLQPAKTTNQTKPRQETSQPRANQMLLTRYHPGQPPIQPEYPGKRAPLIFKAWYYLQRWRWRNHHQKDSPWWDWYRKYLNSGAWKKVRKAALVRDGYKCQTKGCGQKAVEVHHKYYRYVGREWEQMSCLVSICKQHHDREHGKFGFWHWIWGIFSPQSGYPARR
jgi:hypothetical protein